MKILSILCILLCFVALNGAGVESRPNPDDRPRHLFVFGDSFGENADKYFYWDDMHPTQAGWETVMEQLQDPIKDFLQLN